MRKVLYILSLGFVMLAMAGCVTVDSPYLHDNPIKGTYDWRLSVNHTNFGDRFRPAAGQSRTLIFGNRTYTYLENDSIVSQGRYRNFRYTGRTYFDEYQYAIDFIPENGQKTTVYFWFPENSTDVIRCYEGDYRLTWVKRKKWRTVRPTSCRAPSLHTFRSASRRGFFVL